MHLERLCAALLVAVLSLAAIFSPYSAAANEQQYLLRRVPRREPLDITGEGEMYEPEDRPLTYREMQNLIRRESSEDGKGVDCCPSVQEMVEPEGGKNPEGIYVELFRDGENRQRFYELSCRWDVEGRPCRFMERKLHNQSRCVQKYSYSYAIVKDPFAEQQRHHHHQHQHLGKKFPSFSSAEGGSVWMLDYIKIRSGCSCEVVPKFKKKRTSNKAKKSKGRRWSDDDWFA